MRAWNVTLSMAICLAASVGWAEKVELRGTVVTWEGKPAAKAEVHLVRIQSAQPEVVVAKSVNADEGGRFAFEDIELPDPEQSRRSLVQIIACAEGNSLEWVSPQAGDPKNLKIKLGKPGTFRGRVKDGTGRPVEGATVRLSVVSRQQTELRVFPHQPFFTQELMDHWAAQTDNDGLFTLWRAGADTSPGAWIRKDGFCSANVHWQDPATGVEVVLRKAGTIRGQIRCGDPTVSLTDVKVAYLPSVEARTGLESYWRRGKSVTDAQGNFTLEEVPPGKVRVNIAPAPTSEWQAGDDKVVELAEGQTVENVVLEMKRGTKVTGRALDADTGKAIAEVRIYAHDGTHYRYSGEWPRTDAEGRYFFYVRPGKIEVRVTDPPPGYLPPPWDARKEMTVREGQEVVVPDFHLKKAGIVRGMVVDQAGLPVLSAVVTYTGQEFGQDMGFPTNFKGTFRLEWLDPDRPMTLLARTETGCSDPVTLIPKNLKEPLKLVLRDGSAAKVRGRVVDDQGKAMPEAKVLLLSHRDAGAPSARWGEGLLRTDEQGRFESTTLWPQRMYSVAASAPSYKPSATSRWQAQPGKVHDFGDIVLQRQLGFVAGRLVDSAGHPVAGAKVWNSGDALKRVEATTDTQGRFRLEGLETGLVYVFAEKEGYRLNGGRQPSPSEGVMLTLYRVDETPPAVKLTPPRELDTSEARRVGLKALDWGLRGTEGEKDKRRRWERANLIVLLARVDPARAAEIAARDGASKDPLGMTMSQRLSLALGHHALKRNVEDALAYFNQVPDATVRAWTLLECAKKLAKTEPEKAKPLLAAAVPPIRGMTKVPVQTVYLALAGRLMTEMGMSGGDQLVDEATVKARNFGLKDSEAYARGAVAEQLCERDLETALALVTPIQDEIERERHLMNIAYRIAPRMPDRAKQVVMSIERAFRRDQGLARLAHRLAPTHLGQAESLAASIQERGETKAHAYVWMAEQIAANDREKAFDHLSQAFETLVEAGKRGRLYRGPSILCGLVVRPAAKLGHPEAHSMVLRSLSLRAPAGGDTGDARSACGPDAALAVALATVDAATAKDFLEMLMPRILAMPAVEDYEYRRAPCDVALAALIVEPALCERFLDQLQKAKRPLEVTPLCEYALGDVKQREEVIRKALRLWRPDEE